MDNVQYIGGSSHDAIISIAGDIVESTPVENISLCAAKRRACSNLPVEDANTKRLKKIMQMCEQTIER